MGRRPSGESPANKEKILDKAIELFAEKGYADVTMREIAQAVGIQASSIYNHYTGKEAILDAIADYFTQELQEQVYPHFATGGDPEAGMEVGEFIGNVVGANTVFFAVPQYAKIGKIIFREQFRSERIRRLLLEELIVRPRQILASYFERLIRAGKMRPVDYDQAAREFHAFFIYEFYENSLAGRIDEEPDARALEAREEHIHLFLRTFCP